MKIQAQSSLRSLVNRAASILCACAMLAAFSQAADSKPPARLSYQTTLADANGLALASDAPKNYDVVFRIYSVSQGTGASLWTEQQTVTIDKGYFSVLLGEGTQVGSESHGDLSTVFSGASASDRYIGVTVKVPGQTDIEIAPRLRLVSSPYTFLAGAAKTVLADDGSLVLDGSTGKIGVKKTNPATELDVNGTVTAVNFVGGGGNLTGINAANIGAGTISSSRLPSLDASQIGSGTFALARIPSLDSSRIPSLDSSKISSGTFDSARVPSLDASKITSGAFTGDRWFNGRLGVGTSPARGFHVLGSSVDYVTARIESSNGAGTWLALGNNTTGGQFWNFISSGSGNGEGAGKLLIGNATGDSFIAVRMTLASDGKVGIGTSSPTCPLDVHGYGTLSQPFAFYAKSGTTAYTGYSGGGANYSILAEHRIAGLEFNAFSDARIKEIAGRSAPEKDLAIVRKLQVTDYTPKDYIRDGKELRKGFIAQEVQKIIPEAVTTSRRMVPDIYALPARVEFDAKARSLRLTMEKDHGLKKGEKVQIFSGQNPLELIVSDVPSARDFVLAGCEKAPADVFVFGREVSDFRTLNYDRIFVTGIGAIQELAKQVDELKSKQARIAELEVKASRVDLLEKEVGEMRKMMTELLKERDTQTAQSPSKGSSAASPLKVSQLNH